MNPLVTNPRAEAGMQRVDARGRIGVVRRENRTRLHELFQEGAARIRLPRTATDPLEAILINTAGGLTGGDRVSWRLEAEAGSTLVATSQACERIYRSSGGTAQVDCRIAAASGARVAWLPQETILFDGSALARFIDVELEPGAECLLVEATVFGRGAMGERVRRAHFTDRWRVRLGGRLVHAEDFRIFGDVDALLRKRPVLDSGTAMATVLMVTPRAADLVEACRTIAGDGGAVSAWCVAGTGKLLARLTAGTGYDLRKRLMPMVSLLNGQAGLPKTWSL